MEQPGYEPGVTGRKAGPLGILACGGPLPLEVAEAGRRQGRAIHIVAIDGFASPEVTRFPHETVSLGQLGRMLASFKRAGVAEMVIAGAMQRPNLLRLKVDWGFFRHLPKVLALTKGGDDSVLRRVIRFFEGEGLTVVGAGDVAPELLAPAGAIAARPPSLAQGEAMARAARLIAALGRYDMGQGVVAGPDGIVAVEGTRGTDAMLRDLGPGGVNEGLGRGAVLVKLAKPGQEMRIDLPTIGPETVRRADAAGLAGIGVGAGAAIVLERARLASEADAAGLFVIGLDAASVGASEAEPTAGIAPGEAGLDVAVKLQVVARRAPTPADRRDIAIGRQLMGVVRAHGAGRAAIVSREHVLAVSGRLPLPAFVAAQGRPASWGRRAVRGRLGVVVVDGSDLDQVLDAALFRAAMQSGIAGLVLLGPLPEGDRRREIVAWADEAGVFLMAAELRP